MLKYYTWRFANRKKIHRCRVELNGVVIYYETIGDPAGIPLLFVHGGTAFIDSYAGQIPFFARLKKYYIIALDSRAHGRSTDSSEPLSYAQITTDVVGLLDHLDISRIFFIGWSDGGIVGLHLGLNFPHLLKKMAIIGTNYHIDGLLDDFSEDLKDTSGKKITTFGPKMMYKMLNPAPNSSNFFKKVRDMWATEPIFNKDEIERIACPTLVMAGENEEYIKPSHTKDLAKFLPNSSLLLVPGADHEIPIKKPTFTNHKIEDFFK